MSLWSAVRLLSGFPKGLGKECCRQVIYAQMGLGNAQRARLPCPGENRLDGRQVGEVDMEEPMDQQQFGMVTVADGLINAAGLSSDFSLGPAT